MSLVSRFFLKQIPTMDSKKRKKIRVHALYTPIPTILLQVLNNNKKDYFIIQTLFKAMMEVIISLFVVTMDRGRGRSQQSIIQSTKVTIFMSGL